MDVGFGVVGLIAAIVVAIVVCVGAVLFLRQRRSRRPDNEHRGKSAFPNQSRLEVLDTTEIDGERRLVLVRCDGIEHLIMTGGPSDVVVENDVRKVRGSGAAGDRASSGMARDRPAAALTATPAVAPARPRPAENARPEPTQAPPAAAQTPVPSRPGVRPAPQPIQAEPQPGRRDSASQWRSPQRQPNPVAANQATDARRSSAKPHGGERPAESPRPSREAATALPGAATPWPEPDSIESEIVEALRFERKLGPGVNAAPKQETAARERKDSAATTLGDLAERLEEALAREVQSTNQALALEPDRTPPSEKSESATVEPRRRSESKLRPELKDREASKPMAAVPEPETRREIAHLPERREEAPVISLNSRRREAVDPLEDEMARLLGELTGDTKGR